MKEKAYRRASILVLEMSKLGRIELDELRRRLARCSLGSPGRRPVVLANMFRTSVKDMTPVSLPDSREPAKAEAGTAAAGAGDDGAAPADGCAASKGVAGADGEGEADSTTHMRWDLVATSLATVCARLE